MLASFRRRMSRAIGAAGTLITGSLLASHVAVAQEKLPAGVVKGASVEGITQYTLSNGLKVLLFPDASKPQTTVNVTYLVGSRNEGYGEAGMAHLLEHMMFKGARHHANPSKELSDHGAQNNAATEFDRTNYFETFPAADSNLVWALDLEADRMVNSFIAKKDLESEFSVVRSEYEMGETDPIRVTLKHALADAYFVHSYRRTAIGWKSDIENVPIERLQAFYHKYYQPDNAVLTITGAFDPARALALVQQKFGAIPRATRVLEQPYSVEPTQDGEREVTVRRVGDTQLMVAYYHVPGGAHPDWPAIDVLTRILGDAPSGRLYQALVVSKKAALAQAQNLQQHDPGGLFTIVQLKKEQSLDSAKAAMLTALEEIATTKPPTQEEVDRAKASLLKGFEMAMSNPTQPGIGFGFQVSDWVKLGDWRLFFVHRDGVKKVTPQDVQRVAALYLKPSNRTLAYFVPTAKPERSEIAANPNVDSIVGSYKSTETVTAGEAFDASTTNIETRTKRSALPSGMKLALLSKKNRGEGVNALIELHIGTTQSLTNKGAIAALTTGMLMRGTKQHTRQQIQDQLNALKAQMSVSSAPGIVYVSMYTTRPNLPAVLKLAAEVLKEPAFDAKELEQLQAADVARFEASRNDPMAAGGQAITSILSPFPVGHPRHVNTVDESIAAEKAATVADLQKFHDEFFGANSGQLAVVGDFDTPEIAKLAGDLFGSWKSREPSQPIADVLTPTNADVKVIETPDKANAFFAVGTNFGMQDTDAQYPAMVVADYLFGGAQLVSRMATRLRQKDGLSYVAASQLVVRATDPVGHWLALAFYNPVNADKLTNAFNDELTKALDAGFTADEVEKAKTSIVQERKVLRANDGQLAKMLADQSYLGRTMTFDAALEKKIAGVTAADVNAAFKRAIDPSKLAVVKAGDFAKAKQAGEKTP